jgi:hypothetical protein
MEKFIVVRVCKNGGGNITSVLTEKDALTHFNSLSDVQNPNNNLFVKVFDTQGREYQVFEGKENQFIRRIDNGWDF